MLNFEINPTSILSGESFVTLVLASILFIIVPLLLVILEYRLTKRNRRYGTYLLVGIFVSAVLFGIVSIAIGIVLTVIYLIALKVLKVLYLFQ